MVHRKTIEAIKRNDILIIYLYCHRKIYFTISFALFICLFLLRVRTCSLYGNYVSLNTYNICRNYIQKRQKDIVILLYEKLFFISLT